MPVSDGQRDKVTISIRPECIVKQNGILYSPRLDLHLDLCLHLSIGECLIRNK